MARTREALTEEDIAEPERPIIVMSSHGFLITLDAMDGMVFVKKGATNGNGR